MTRHRFRFGVVAAQAASGDAWLDKARRAEALGFDTLLIPDGLGPTFAPLPALAAAAAATRTLRVGTYVLANDFRNPVLLAKEAATLDILSGGRFELGLGAGRPSAAADNQMLGLPFDTGGVRVARLAESLRLVTTLLSGQRAQASGPFYKVADAVITPPPLQQPHPPLLVAGSGKHLLTLAARTADMVALGVAPAETEADVAEKIEWLRTAAGPRFADLEINLNLMAIGNQVPRYLRDQLGLDADGLARCGAISALTGSTDEMCERLMRRRETLGISYYTVSDELMEAAAPIVARLAGR